MVTKQNKSRPWGQYQAIPNYLLLEPGWAGVVDDDELAFIQRTMKQDPALSFSWGFRPGQKTRPEAAIRRVAMDGDPDHRQSNRKLARVRTEMPAAEHEGSLTAMGKNIEEVEWSTGSPAQLEMAFS